jgi:hypothetical protein
MREAKEFTLAHRQRPPNPMFHSRRLNPQGIASSRVVSKAVNIVNIFRGGTRSTVRPTKGLRWPPSTLFYGPGERKGRQTSSRNETNRPDIYGYGGPQKGQKAQVPLRRVNDLHVAHSTGEQNSGDRRNRTLPSHPEQRAYIRDTVGSRQTRAVSRFRKAEPRGSRGPSWARIARPSCAG